MITLKSSHKEPVFFKETRIRLTSYRPRDFGYRKTVG